MAGDESLRAWASENGYRVRSANPIPLEHLGNSTRMFFGAEAGASAFYVVLEHRNGRSRRGWALCRDSPSGRRSNRVKVRWHETVREALEWEWSADEPRPPASPAASHPEAHPLWDGDLDG
jgi:hypothetical protein